MEMLRKTLTELRDEHEVLRVQMRAHARLMENLRAPDEAYLDSLVPARLRFREILHAHALAEGDVVATVFLREQPEEGPALAAIFPFGMRGVLGQYDRLMASWCRDRIRDDWTRYRESVLVVQRQLAERMAWEEREVYLRLV